MSAPHEATKLVTWIGEYLWKASEVCKILVGAPTTAFTPIHLNQFTTQVGDCAIQLHVLAERQMAMARVLSALKDFVFAEERDPQLCIEESSCELTLCPRRGASERCARMTWVFGTSDEGSRVILQSVVLSALMGPDRTHERTWFYDARGSMTKCHKTSARFNTVILHQIGEMTSLDEASQWLVQWVIDGQKA